MRSPLPSKATGGRSLAREWILFAICLGLGGHIALGVVLHAPGFWSLRQAGLNGLLTGLGLYVAIQIGRSVWWGLRTPPKPESGTS